MISGLEKDLSHLPGNIYDLSVDNAGCKGWYLKAGEGRGRQGVDTLSRGRQRVCTLRQGEAGGGTLRQGEAGEGTLRNDNGGVNTAST